MRDPCAVHTCKNEGTLLFPMDESLRSQWIRALRLDVVKKPGWSLKKYAYICSEHFKPTDFIYKPPLYEGDRDTKRLKKQSVPSIFPWTASHKLPQLADLATNKNVTFTKTHPEVPVIDSTPIVKARTIFITGNVNSKKQYGHCLCCLKEDKHTVGDVRGMLECFNVEVSTDPSVAQLLCHDCCKFLLQARKFRDMVAASQTKLSALQKCMSKNIGEKTITVKIEFDAENSYVKKEMDTELSLSSSNVNESKQKTTNLDILKRYLTSDPSIGLSIAVQQPTKKEKLESVPGSIPGAAPPLDALGDRPDDGTADDGGFSELSDDTDGETYYEENENNLTAGQIKLMEKQMDAQLNLQMQENLSTILQNSTIIPFALANKSDKFECIYCDKNYTHFTELRDHVKTKHNEKYEFKLRSLKMLALKRDPDIILRADISLMNCRLCGKKFATIDNLVEHLVDEHDKKYHNISRGPPHNILCFDMSLDCLKCLECGKVFTNFRGLLMHMNQHYGSYLCPECGGRFMHERSLKLHMMQKGKRNLPRPQCPICDATYSRKDHLRRHLKVKHPDMI